MVVHVSASGFITIFALYKVYTYIYMCMYECVCVCVCVCVLRGKRGQVDTTLWK